MSARTLGPKFAVGILVLVVAGSAYLLGRSAAADEREVARVRQQAAEVGYANTLTAGRMAGYDHGFKAGTVEGLKAGRAAGTRAGAALAVSEIERRAGVSAEVSAEAAASVAASEQAEAEALYYETHPWAKP